MSLASLVYEVRCQYGVVQFSHAKDVKHLKQKTNKGQQKDLFLLLPSRPGCRWVSEVCRHGGKCNYIMVWIIPS